MARRTFAVLFASAVVMSPSAQEMRFFYPPPSAATIEVLRDQSYGTLQMDARVSRAVSARLRNSPSRIAKPFDSPLDRRGTCETMPELEGVMRQLLVSAKRYPSAIVIAIVASIAVGAASQPVHEAPATATSTGRVAPEGEPGRPLHVSGQVVGPDGAPISGASLYVYQTDHEGYYGVKPASDNRNPRLKLFLRSDAKGQWSFETVRPGSYPNSRVPPHIHFEVSAAGRSPKIFEIVFEGDSFVTQEMRRDPAFSVRPIADGRVTERIVLK